MKTYIAIEVVTRGGQSYRSDEQELTPEVEEAMAGWKEITSRLREVSDFSIVATHVWGETTYHFHPDDISVVAILKIREEWSKAMKR